MNVEALGAIIADELRCLCRELEARFGWAGFDVAAHLAAPESKVTLSGTAVSARSADEACGRVARHLPGWKVVRDMRPWLSDHFLEVIPPFVDVCSGLPGSSQSSLSTQWHAANGPVERLAQRGNQCLVRALDGTVGWVQAQRLGARTRAPTLPMPAADRDAFQRQLLEFVDVPYLLGGVTRQGIDCTGLTQICLLWSSGLLLPRHSTDQLAFCRHADVSNWQPGDLAFSWTEREGPCHVGVVLQEAQIIHASVSRRRVVVDAMPRFLEQTSQIKRLAFGDMLQQAKRLAGKGRYLLGWSCHD